MCQLYGGHRARAMNHSLSSCWPDGQSEGKERHFFSLSFCLLSHSFSFFVYVCVNNKRCFMPWRGAVVRDTDCGNHQRGIQRWHASPTAVPGHTCTHTDAHSLPTAFEKKEKCMHTSTNTEL